MRPNAVSRTGASEQPNIPQILSAVNIEPLVGDERGALFCTGSGLRLVSSRRLPLVRAF